MDKYSESFPTAFHAAPARLRCFLRKYYTPAFYMYLAFIVFKSMLTATMIRVDWWTGRVESILQLLALAMVVWKAAADDGSLYPWSTWERMLAAFLCGGLLFSWHAYPYAFIYELAVLIFLARGMEFRKILIVHLAVSIAVTLTAVILALTGHIENLIYYQEAHNYKARIAFGFVYPTDFCAHLLFMALSSVWLAGRKIKWVHIGILAALGIFCWAACDARTTTLLFAALVVYLVIMKVRDLRKRHKGQHTHSTLHRIRAVVDWLVVLSAPVCAAVMILMSRFYTESNRLMRFLDNLLSYRLQLGHIGFERFPVRIWAQNVEMHGAGGSVSPTGEYFFLDCSYVNILLRLGLVVLVAVLLMLVIITNRERRAGNHLKLFILLLIIVASVVEHHLIEIQTNPFLLLVLAVDEGGCDTVPCDTV